MRMYLIAKVSVRAIRKFDARVGASEFPPTGYPVDCGAFIKQVNWVEILNPFFHYQPHSQYFSLIVIGNELCWQHFYHCICILLLWICNHRIRHEKL